MIKWKKMKKKISKLLNLTSNHLLKKNLVPRKAKSNQKLCNKKSLDTIIKQGLKYFWNKVSKTSSQILKELERATKESRTKRKRFNRNNKSKSNKILNKRSTIKLEDNLRSSITSKSITTSNN